MLGLQTQCLQADAPISDLYFLHSAVYECSGMSIQSARPFTVHIHSGSRKAATGLNPGLRRAGIPNRFVQPTSSSAFVMTASATSRENQPDASLTQVGRQAVQGGINAERYELDVPLDRFDDEDTRLIKVSFRLVTGESSLADKVLVYLQGGPGFQGPPPSSASGGWIKAALDKKYTVLLLDQRGTGFSTPISCRSLEAIGSPADQASYLKKFRADSIIRDAEAVREAMKIDKWSTLGQSYGGFLTLTYLCSFPESLQACFLTGGIPPHINLPMSAELVYESTIKKVIKQNIKFYQRFPDAEELARKVVNHVVAQEGGRVITPCGNYLTPQSFQLLGLGCLGFSGGFEKLHGLLESAFEPDGRLAFSFLKDFDNSMSFDTNPIYAILHESIYCQGNVASDWAANRVRSRPEYQHLFDAAARAAADEPVYFTGEMVFPFVFDDFAELRPIKEAAGLIAQDTTWSELYPNVERLRDNRVPIACACYFEDMFVSFDLAEETIEKIGNVRQFVTNEYLHCGIREGGARIMEKLFGLIDGKELLR
jgi:pimeloyl-ACP methyl ester carboxylesterase